MPPQSSEPEELELVFVMPAHNEAVILARSVKQFYEVLQQYAPSPWRLVIAENASSDETRRIAEALITSHPWVIVRSDTTPGKGRAIANAWESMTAKRYGFIDTDLSVDMSVALPRLLEALGTADMVVASRHHKDSVIVRPLYRKIISRVYRLFLKIIIGTKLSDVACGCKLVSADIVRHLMPQVQNRDWFFDSELTLLAEANGYTIKEVGVHWKEYEYPERERQVPLMKVSAQYLRAIWELRLRLKTLRR